MFPQASSLNGLSEMSLCLRRIQQNSEKNVMQMRHHIDASSHCVSYTHRNV